jgi:hypothetical protein
MTLRYPEVSARAFRVSHHVTPHRIGSNRIMSHRQTPALLHTFGIRVTSFVHRIRQVVPSRPSPLLSPRSLRPRRPALRLYRNPLITSQNPTQSDRTALKTYFHLFSRLYPCGECAAEFQALLKQYPPQTSSRKSASLWLCHVHNQVNERLGKPEFDCLTLDATYDCGCGDEESGTKSAGTGPDPVTPPPRPGLQNKILGGKGGLRGGAGQGWKQAAAKPGDRGVEENDVLEERTIGLDVPGKEERQAEVLRAIAAENPRGIAV